MTLAVALLAALVVAPTAHADPITVRSVGADPMGAVKVSDLSGSVVVTGWPEPRVRLAGSIGRDASGVRLEQGAGGVSIGVAVPEGLKPDADVAGDLVVDAPARSSLTIDSTSANVRVDRMVGRMMLSSVTGQLFVSCEVPFRPQTATSSSADPAAAAPSSIDARSIAGAVLIYGQLPEVAASTVSGSIDLRGTMPAISIQTTKGVVRVVDALLREGSVSAINGGIYLWCRLPAGAHLSIKSLSGLVFLRLTPDSEPRITLTSYTGRLSTNRLVDRGRPIQVAPPRAGGSTTAVIGRGDSSVAITDYAGDIILTNEPPPTEAK